MIPKGLFWSVALSTLFALVASQDCSVSTVTDLVLTEVDEGLAISWTTLENAEGCNVEYVVVVSNNVDTLDPRTFVTTDTSITVSNLVPCSVTTVEVSVVGGVPASATITLATSVTTAPILRDMITSCNSIQMIWEAQPFEENVCQVTHFQMFCLSDVHNFTIPQAVTDVRDRTFDILITVLQPDIYYTCNGFIFVTLAGFSPPSDSIEFWSNLDSVRDLEVEETDTSFRASWEAPLNSEECGVAYAVTYENEVLGSTSVEVVGLSHEFDIELIPCTDYTFTVTPISFTGSKGTPVSTDVTPSIRVGQVSYLVATDIGDSIVVSWTAAQVGRCAVSYIVERSVDGDLVETYETVAPSLAFDRIPCATSTFSVRVVSEEIVGETVSIELVLDASDITSISEVRNVRLEDNLVLWDPPETVGLCDIEYSVVNMDQFGVTEYRTTTTSVNLNWVPCSNNIVSITGISGDVVGVPNTIAITAPTEELSAPSHVSTIPDFTSATISLQAQAFYENLCAVEGVVMECSNDNGDSFERSIEVDDNQNRLFTVNVDNLEQDTIYTCVARLQNSPSGDEFAFRTIPLPTKELVISDIGETSFLTSWSEDYGQQFVNGYTLIVESKGPIHSVPDRCDIERGAVYTFDIPNTELSSLFVQGFANYLYSVSLITSYTLGVERSSSVVSEQTLTGVPGYPDSLQSNLILGDSGTFDASSLITWRVPCDLNGGLRGFGLNISAVVEFAGTEQRLFVDAGFAAEDSDVNSEFSYTLENLNPFFLYEVEVNVDAAAEGPVASLSIQAPSACLCDPV